MNGAWSRTKGMMQMGLNLALQALTPGSACASQALEKVKDARRGPAGRRGQGLSEHRGRAVALGVQGSRPAARP